MSRAAPEREAPAAKPARGLKAFFVERLGLDALGHLAAKKRVPIHKTTWFYFLGGMALFLFLIQIVTGMLLTLFYKPHPETAFESVQAIMTDVPFGWLIRSIHSWGANLLIGVLFLHLLTTFVMRAYKRPREMTWVTGVLLLGIFLVFGFSGYLLPWNELAFFATRVGTKIAGVIPLVGEDLLLLSRGGEEVTGDTLARFYGLHVAILPLLAMVLVGVHLYLVQKHGMSVPSRVAWAYGGKDKVPSMPFFPHFLLRDAVGWYVALGLLAALAALFPWELGSKADPFGTAPPNIKPEWYFLFMFETLKRIPPHVAGMEGEVLGIFAFGLAALAVLFVPFLDRGAAFDRPRRVLNTLAALAVAFFLAMTIVGFA